MISLIIFLCFIKYNIDHKNREYLFIIWKTNHPKLCYTIEKEKKKIQ